MSEGVEYGVNLVQEHSRWSNIFQELRGKVTLEICAYGACRMRIFEISAADVIQWGVRVAELIAEQASTAKVPIGVGGGDGPEGYVPLFTGEMAREANLADQSAVGSEAPPYEYEVVIPPEE